MIRLLFKIHELFTSEPMVAERGKISLPDVAAFFGELLAEEAEGVMCFDFLVGCWALAVAEKDEGNSRRVSPKFLSWSIAVLDFVPHNWRVAAIQQIRDFYYDHRAIVAVWHEHLNPIVRWQAGVSLPVAPLKKTAMTLKHHLHVVIGQKPRLSEGVFF